MNIRTVTVAAVAAVLALTACGSDDDSSSADTAADAAEESAPVTDEEPDVAAGDAAGDATITISDFAFGDPITVAPGTEVTVTNADGAPHSVTSSDAGFTSGILDPGASGSITAPSEPGTYAFVCAVHPSMTGELIVG